MTLQGILRESPSLNPFPLTVWNLVLFWSLELRNPSAKSPKVCACSYTEPENPSGLRQGFRNDQDPLQEGDVSSRAPKAWSCLFLWCLEGACRDLSGSLMLPTPGPSVVPLIYSLFKQNGGCLVWSRIAHLLPLLFFNWGCYYVISFLGKIATFYAEPE